MLIDWVTLNMHNLCYIFLMPERHQLQQSNFLTNSFTSLNFSHLFFFKNQISCAAHHTWISHHTLKYLMTEIFIDGNDKILSLYSLPDVTWIVKLTIINCNTIHRDHSRNKYINRKPISLSKGIWEF